MVSSMLVTDVGTLSHSKMNDLKFKEGPLENFFLSAGHPLTVPNGVILCQIYDAIKQNSVYIDFMCRRDDL